MRLERQLVLSLCFTTVACAAEPRLDLLTPQGVQRGTEIEVKLSGARVGEEPQQVLFYETGIEVLQLRSADKNNTIATLRLAEDCPLGIHPIRLRTSTGLSNLRTLHVGTLPAVSEIEPNNTPAKAQPIKLGHTIHGVVQPEDQDLFEVEVRAGQRVSIEVEGLRLGRTLFDPLLEVLDEAGQVLVSNDDRAAAKADAFLTIVAERDEKLVVRLREVAFRGDGRSSYLLHVGDFPRPLAVSPLAVHAGEKAELAYISGDGNQSSEAVVPVADSSESLHAHHAQDQGGFAPTPLPLWVTDLEPTLEAEPNDSNTEATPLPCPGIACGTIQQASDRDRFRFTAKKGKTLDIRCRARELRSPLDSVIRLFDAKGKRLAANDDDRGNPDSYLRFKPPADGEYLIEVEDRLQRGDPTRGYVLDISTPRPVAEIKLDERRRYETTVIEVPRGGRTSAILTVTRRDFGGELQAVLNGLPRGVSAECFPLAGNFNRVPVVFEAAVDADLDASLATVSVRPTATKNPPEIESRFRQQTWLVRGRNNVPVLSHFARRMPVAVTERLPFSIELDKPKAPICRGGSMDLRVSAKRDEGFDQSVRVYTLYHPPGVSSNRSRSIVKGKDTAAIPVTANGKARTGDWPLVVVGETNLNGRVYTSTQFVTLKVAEPYFDLVVPTLTVTQGKACRLVVDLSPRTEFEGSAKLELVGLPRGVESSVSEVEVGAASAKFDLTIANDAKLGRHRGIGCRVTLMVDGEPVVYRQGRAELRIDPPREQTAASDSIDGGPSA